MFPGGAVSSLNTPPTPFADRESLEAELKALEKDIDHIQQLKVRTLRFLLYLYWSYYMYCLISFFLIELVISTYWMISIKIHGTGFFTTTYTTLHIIPTDQLVGKFSSIYKYMYWLI